MGGDTVMDDDGRDDEDDGCCGNDGLQGFRSEEVVYVALVFSPSAV